jgi:hypothetical protein
MQTPPYATQTPQPVTGEAPRNSRPSDLVYPALTALAMILLLVSLWVY